MVPWVSLQCVIVVFPDLSLDYWHSQIIIAFWSLEPFTALRMSISYVLIVNNCTEISWILQINVWTQAYIIGFIWDFDKYYAMEQDIKFLANSIAYNM